MPLVKTKKWTNFYIIEFFVQFWPFLTLSFEFQLQEHTPLIFVLHVVEHYADNGFSHENPWISIWLWSSKNSAPHYARVVLFVSLPTWWHEPELIKKPCGNRFNKRLNQRWGGRLLILWKQRMRKIALRNAPSERMHLRVT